MENLIHNVFGCMEPSIFFKQLKSMSHLAAMVLHYTPKTYQANNMFMGRHALRQHLPTLQIPSISSPCDRNGSSDDGDAVDLLNINGTDDNNDTDVDTCLDALKMTDSELDIMLARVAEHHVQQELLSADELSEEDLEGITARLNVSEIKNMLQAQDRTHAAVYCTRVVESIDILSKRGTTDVDDKVKSLQARWWSRRESVASSLQHGIMRNMVFYVEGELYRVLGVYRKSYNKWRIESCVAETETSWVHLQKVRETMQHLRKITGDARKIYISTSSSFLKHGDLQYIVE
jgi:hypothetical protein